MFLLIACTSGKPKDDNNIVDEPVETPLAEEQSLKMSYSLLDKDYILPTPYKTLKEDGWILEDDPTFVLESQEFIKNRFVRNGPHILELSFYNPNNEAQTLENSLISAVASENRTFGPDIASDIVVHDSINFETDVEIIIDLLGDYEHEESAQYDTYIFQHDSLSKTEIKIELDTDTTRWITIENFKLD